MTEAPKTPVGKFCWYEYLANDLDAAKAFYGKVVGWHIQPPPMNSPFRYEIGSVDGYGVSGMMEIDADMKAMGIKPCWTGYVWVEDVDKAAARLTAAGGSARRPAMDIPGVGRFRVVADPDGAAFILFRDAGGNPPPEPAPGTPGLVGWRELYATDGAKAFAFYAGQFGWKKDREFDMGAMGAYHIFESAPGEQGGMMSRDAQIPVSCWNYYFNVEAIDAAAARVTAGGGKIMMGPSQVPGGQWIVQAIDPQGAMFALVAPAR
jgi:uncharacterized protein